MIAYGFKSVIPPRFQSIWGARTILKYGYIDLVPDRQDSEGPQPHLDRLYAWIDEKAMPQLRERSKGLRGDSDEVLEIEESPFTLKASCKRSFGYLYITAWENPPEQGPVVRAL